MEGGRRSTETVQLDSGLPPAAASPTRPRTSPRPNRGGRAAAYRLFGGFCDEPSSSPPGSAQPERRNASADATRRSRPRRFMVGWPIDAPRWRLMMRPHLSATVLVLLISALVAAPAAAAPDGQMTWGVHISLAPTWFDPAETPGIVTPFMVLYGLHDAMLKALPGNPLAPSLAESWTVSPDGLTYEFVLRRGVKFHNGEPVTAEDVKFSFERYRGSANKALKERVATVETPDPGRVRFRLKQPWPDFVMFYSTATGAGWIVPKKYVEKVGDDGFKKAPIGAGPY